LCFLGSHCGEENFKECPSISRLDANNPVNGFKCNESSQGSFEVAVSVIGNWPESGLVSSV